MSKASEKLLVAIEKGNQYKEEFTVPFDLTQDGLASSADIVKSHASRLLKDLEDSGLIITEKKHVWEKKRRMSAYFLTQKGMMEIERLREDGLIKTRIDFADQRPRVKRFYGREKEIEEFKDWLKNTSSPVLIVRGIAGIGKTTFVSWSLDKHCSEQNLFWYRFHEWSSLRPVLQKLSEFLGKIGKRRLSAYLMGKDDIDLNELAILLESELNKIDSVIVFDDYHKVQDENVQRLLEIMIELLPNRMMVRMAIIGREIPGKPYKISDLMIKETIKEMSLAGFAEEDCALFADSKDISPKHLRNIYEVTKGHPMALSLLGKGGEAVMPSIRAYFEEEIISQLSEDERAVLDAASLFRQPEPATAFLEIAEKYRTEGSGEPTEEEEPALEASDYKNIMVDSQTVHVLTKKSLMFPTGDGFSYAVHDLIKSFALSRMTAMKRKSCHALISNYYAESKKNDPSIMLEALYHMLTSEQNQEAAELANIHSKDIIYGGHGREFLKALEAINVKTLEPSSRARVLLSKGKIHMLQEELDVAIGSYMPSIRLFEESGDKIGESEAYLDIGEIMWKRNLYDEAEENYNISLQLAKEAKDIAGIAEASRCLGRVYWRREEHKDALDILLKSLKEGEKLEDKHFLAKVYRNISGVYSHLGEYPKALEYLDMSLSLSEELEDKNLEGMIYNTIGFVNYLEGDLEKSISVWAKTIEISQEYAFIRSLTNALANTAEAHMELGNLDIALDFCDRALVFKDKVSEKDVIANILMVAGKLYSEKGDVENSIRMFKDALEMAEGSGVLMMIGQVHSNYGRMLAKISNKKEATLHYQKSLDIFKEIDNPTMLDNITKEMKENL